MKKFAILIPILCLALTGCLSSETATLTTTQGQTAATLDANPGIAQGQAITANNAQTGAVVNSVNSLGLVMSLPATGTGPATATFKNTVAMQLAQDESKLKEYGQDIGTALQQNLPKLEAVASDTVAFTKLVQQITSAAGLTPVTPSQASVFTKIENGATQVATDSALLSTLISGIQQTGTVIAAPTGN